MAARELCLGYGSAVEVWRSARREVAMRNPEDLLVQLLFDRAPYVDVTPLPLPLARSTAPSHVAGGQLGNALRFRPARSGLVDCVVSEQRGREHYRGVACHLCGGPYPEGSYCDAGDGLLVTGVPLTLLHLSRTLGDAAMLQLLGEFMGFFVCDPTSGTGLRHGPPLATARQIRCWVESARKLRVESGLRMPKGTGRLLGLLDLAVERAASPGEVRTALLLSLPRALGGYGLCRPELNAVTQLPEAAARAYGVPAYACDLTVSEFGLMMEYRGEQVHKQLSTRLTDARKGNILGHLGYEVLVVEKQQIGSLALADELARMVAERIGVALEPPTPVELEARLRLRRDLLGPWVGF